MFGCLVFVMVCSYDVILFSVITRLLGLFVVFCVCWLLVICFGFYLFWWVVCCLVGLGFGLGFGCGLVC